MSFDAVADSYDEIRAIPEWVLREFYETISRKGMQFNRDSVVLDAGVGTGRTIGPVVEIGVQFVGIDLSKKMLEKAAEKVNRKSLKSRVSLVRGDVANLPFRPRSFDMVISVHVLWLINKWKQAILESKRVLRDKGYFIVASHNSPEFENEVGRKYLEVEQNAFGQRRLSRMLYVFKRNSTTRKLVERRTTQLLMEAVAPSREQSLESFLTRKTRLQKEYAIRWKQTYSINAIVSLLDERLGSLRWSTSAKTFEQLKLDLAKWESKKLEESPFLDVPLYFMFTIVQV